MYSHTANRLVYTNTNVHVISVDPVCALVHVCVCLCLCVCLFVCSANSVSVCVCMCALLTHIQVLLHRVDEVHIDQPCRPPRLIELTGSEKRVVESRVAMVPQRIWGWFIVAKEMWVVESRVVVVVP